MAEGRSPRVVRKVYKVQYKQPGQQNSGPRNNMNVYDTNKDSNIFQLGNAFQTGDFDIDAFLNQMSTDPKTQVSKGDDGKTTFTSVNEIDDKNVPYIDIDGDGVGDIPAITRKRIITITRGDGTTYQKELDPGQDPNDLIRGLTGGEIIDSQVEEPKDKKDEPKEQKKGKKDKKKEKDDKDDYLAKTNRLVLPEVKVIGTSPQPSPAVSKEDLSKLKPGFPNNGYGAPDRTPLIDDSPDDDILANRRASLSPATFYSRYEDDLVSSSDEEIQPRWHSSLCPGRRRKMKRHLSLDIEKKGVKQGMMSSEVAVPGEDNKLPAIQMMVMNYNRMLEENPEEFRDTLFRAVKLDGVDVVKILLRLIQRKKISLASDAMREPESSATILHVALLLNLKRMVEYLVSVGDKELLMATYTKPEYKNQTTLHVAVANGNLKIVELLLRSLKKKDRKQLMNTVADGSYFKHTHPEGQLCVSAAAWSRNSDTLILLAKYGASFATANTNGDTLLHTIVKSSVESPDGQDYQQLIMKVFDAVGEWAKHCRYKSTIVDQRRLEIGQKQVSTFHKLLELGNNEGCTPLNLASQLSSPLMLSLINMEKIYKIPQTKLGSIAWVTYDVTDVTTFALGSYNKFSVLHVLAHNSKLGHTGDNSSTLDTEPLKSLISKKWSVYQWIYFSWFLIHLFYMTLLTALTTTAAPPWNNMSVPYDEYAHEHYKPKIALSVFGFLPLFYLVLEFLDLLGSYPYSLQYMHGQSVFQKIKVRIQTEMVIVGNGPYRFVLFGHSFATLVWIYHYLNGNTKQIIALSISLLLGWIFLMFFTRALKSTSRFSIMIQKMFFRDLMYFVVVFGLIMVAFTMAINAMYSNIHAVDIKPIHLLYQMLNVVIELEDKGPPPPNAYPTFTLVLVVIYTIMAVILMLNMLIAMMNTSYEAVRVSSENVWAHQQLSIMLMMERRLFWWRWLCLRSEGNIWYKEFDTGTRAFVDVTTTQSNLQ